MVKGHRPKTKSITLEEWKQKISSFPTKIREVFVCGGEPTLIKWMPDLVNWLIEEGYHVVVFSNLYKPLEFLRVKKSYRMQIRTTFHHIDEESLERFESSYNFIKLHHNINVDEIGTEKKLSYSTLKPYLTMDDLKIPEFRYAPDGKLYTSHYELSQNQE
jgi:uncharacterized radical SAM superfamily Fe-S cluster-containing enzyme